VKSLKMASRNDRNWFSLSKD